MTVSDGRGILSARFSTTTDDEVPDSVVQAYERAFPIRDSMSDVDAGLWDGLDDDDKWAVMRDRAYYSSVGDDRPTTLRDVMGIRRVD